MQDLGFLWAVNPKAEPVEIDSHSTPKVPFRGLLTVPDDATRARKFNYLAGERSAHNPKVGGSNPPPATKQIRLVFIDLDNQTTTTSFLRPPPV